MEERIAIGLVILITLGPIYGWCANVYKFCHLDFQAPYGAEIIRGVGIFAPPVGMVTGYMTLNEEEKKGN